MLLMLCLRLLAVITLRALFFAGVAFLGVLVVLRFFVIRERIRTAKGKKSGQGEKVFFHEFKVGEASATMAKAVANGPIGTPRSCLKYFNSP